MGAKHSVPPGQQLPSPDSHIVAVQTLCTSDIRVYIYFTVVEDSNIIGVNTGSEGRDRFLYLIMHIPLMVEQNCTVEQKIRKCMESFGVFKHFGAGVVRPVNEGDNCIFQVVVPVLRSTAVYDLVMAFANNSIALDNNLPRPFLLTQENISISLDFFPFNLDKGANPLCPIVLKNYPVEWKTHLGDADIQQPYTMNRTQHVYLQAIRRKSSGTFAGSFAKEVQKQAPNAAGLAMTHMDTLDRAKKFLLSQSDPVLKSYMRMISVCKKELKILHEAIKVLNIGELGHEKIFFEGAVKLFLEKTESLHQFVE